MTTNNTTPPSWCEPNAEPKRYGGDVVYAWTRDLPDGSTWIECFDQIVDGRVYRSEPRIRMLEPDDDGYTPAQACQLAAALLNAVDLISGAQ